MHNRDTWYEYAVKLDVDPHIAESIDESNLINKAEDVLEDELGAAAKWFEVAETVDQQVTFELRVGTAHTHDADEDDARDRAEEWATEMFERVDAPVAIADLKYRGVTVPTADGDVPIEAYHADSDNEDEDGSDDSDPADEAATIDSDGPTDGDGSTETETADESESDEAVTLEYAMGGYSW